MKIIYHRLSSSLYNNVTMKIKTKTERYNFIFTKETSDLLRKIADKTDLNFTKIVQRAIEGYAKEKGVENE